MGLGSTEAKDLVIIKLVIGGNWCWHIKLWYAMLHYETIIKRRVCYDSREGQMGIIKGISAGKNTYKQVKTASTPRNRPLS